MVEFLIHKMDGAPGDFHAIGKGLLLSFEAGERRQKRRMDIKNASGKLLHEPGREKAHVSGQTNEIGLVLLERADDFAIVRLAIFALGWYDESVQAELSGRLD